jgi:magnesium transporter
MPANASSVRVVVRRANGETDCDWPADRIAEALADPTATVWVDIVESEKDLAWVEKLFRETFHFHPLAIEDALSETHSPKVDDWGGYLYTVYHTVDYDPATGTIALHELDIFLGPNYLVTFHAGRIALIDKLRTMFERDGGERLSHGADHALYFLFDAGSDDYMKVIDQLDERIDDCQDEAIGRPRRKTLQRILETKRACLRVHRILAPQREVFNRLARDKFGPIDAEDRVYFRDVYDHLVRLHDILDSMRDLANGALDTYMSAVSNRTNDVMKTLTIVNVLFLPMNFLAGFFGMNFFGANIDLGDIGLPHRFIFGLVCISFLSAPWGLWAFGKWRRWF